MVTFKLLQCFEWIITFVTETKRTQSSQHEFAALYETIGLAVIVVVGTTNNNVVDGNDDNDCDCLEMAGMTIVVADVACYRFLGWLVVRS